MSLIQDALERMGRTTPSHPSAKKNNRRLWERDPMGSKLEQELTKIQREYIKRRNLRKILVIGFLVVCLSSLAVLIFNTKFLGKISYKGAPVKGSSSVKIIFGGVYRLSGITKFGNERKAVINDEHIGVGEQLSEDIFVKEIQKNKVILVARGKEIPFKL
ncbi:MAG TPA: hypothetical protein PLO78_04680 [Candidatus Omnitrophota bacterium]|nr:hypothetical protein [Candidatus Omnitrophota bacterium]